ncbi:MAG: hypothetical protein ACQEXB_01225 [Bacillota bacterium]
MSIRSLHPEVQVGMFEKWMEITAEELLNERLIDKPHEPIVDLKTARFVDVVNCSPYYFEKGCDS